GAGESHLGQGPVEGGVQVEIIKGLAHGNTRSLRKRQIIGDYLVGSYGECGLVAIIAHHFCR
ncbi:MAG: hypothetical protein ACRCWV_03345, partial [Raoultella sp.]